MNFLKFPSGRLHEPRFSSLIYINLGSPLQAPLNNEKVTILRGPAESCKYKYSIQNPIVSTYNIFFSNFRTGTSEKTLFGGLLVHWNGIATVLYDPRPAVQKFMLSKDNRKMNLPTVCT